jgi:hypothetical protein
MRRHRLLSLEKLGLVMEMADCGYARSFIGTGALQPTGDPIEDARLQRYMLRKGREIELSRHRRIKRLRRLARMDFKMIGGVAPVGFYGGAGGAGGSFRPTSMSARS